MMVFGLSPIAGQLGIAAGFFTALLLVLRWMGKYFEKIATDAKEERLEWQTKIDKMNENNTRQLESNGTFQKSVSDSHEFQREEHKNMVLSLQEVTLTLKSMNGKGGAISAP